MYIFSETIVVMVFFVILCRFSSKPQPQIWWPIELRCPPVRPSFCLSSLSCTGKHFGTEGGRDLVKGSNERSWHVDVLFDTFQLHSASGY